MLTSDRVCGCAYAQIDVLSCTFHLPDPCLTLAHLGLKSCAALLSVATIGRMRITSQGRRPEIPTDRVSYTHEALITLRPTGFFSATVPTAAVHEGISNTAMVLHGFAVQEDKTRLKNRRPRLRLHFSLVYGEHGFSGALTVGRSDADDGRIVLSAVLGAIRTGNVSGGGGGDSDSLTTL